MQNPESSPTRLTAKVSLYVPEQGKYLFVRGERPIEQGGWWNLLGGGIDEGENPIDALVREAREEIGLPIHRVEELTYLDTVTSTTPDRSGKEQQRTWLTFTGILPETHLSSLPSADDHQPTGLFSPDEALRHPRVSCLAKQALELSLPVIESLQQSPGQAARRKHSGLSSQLSAPQLVRQ